MSEWNNPIKIQLKSSKYPPYSLYIPKIGHVMTIKFGKSWFNGFNGIIIEEVNKAENIKNVGNTTEIATPKQVIDLKNIIFKIYFPSDGLLKSLTLLDLVLSGNAKYIREPRILAEFKIELLRKIIPTTDANDTIIDNYDKLFDIPLIKHNKAGIITLLPHVNLADLKTKEEKEDPPIIDPATVELTDELVEKLKEATTILVTNSIAITRTGLQANEDTTMSINGKKIQLDALNQTPENDKTQFLNIFVDKNNKPLDEPVKFNDDGMDAMRYGFYNGFKAANKKISWF